MLLSNKISKWIENQIITENQAIQILEYEKTHNSKKFWKIAYMIAGLLIGLGFCLIVAANWEVLPTGIKIVGDFALLGGSTYGIIWAINHHKKSLQEFFSILSFLMIGATIGLIGQTFNLDGGWQSFALGWSILGLPFVLLSKSFFFNLSWLCLFFSLFNLDLFDFLFKYLDEYQCMCCAVLVLSALSYAGKKLDTIIPHKITLPKAFSFLSIFVAYIIIFNFSCSNHTPFLIYVFSFLWFGLMTFYAVKNQNVILFKRNAFAVEMYIFLLFATRFGNLLISGFGFVFGGLFILLMIFGLKRTNKLIKNMDFSNE